MSDPFCVVHKDSLNAIQNPGGWGGDGLGEGGGMPLLDETIVASGVHVCIHCHSKLLGRDARGNFKINVIFD